MQNPGIIIQVVSCHKFARLKNMFKYKYNLDIITDLGHSTKDYTGFCGFNICDPDKIQYPIKRFKTLEEVEDFYYDLKDLSFRSELIQRSSKENDTKKSFFHKLLFMRN